MSEFRARLREDGRIVIPAVYRKQLHLEPGEELIIRVEDDELRLTSLKNSLKKAQKTIQLHARNKSLQKILKKMRTEDAKNE